MIKANRTSKANLKKKIKNTKKIIIRELNLKKKIDRTILMTKSMIKSTTRNDNNTNNNCNVKNTIKELQLSKKWQGLIN